MTEADPSDANPSNPGRPARRWPVLAGSAVLVLGALALAVWAARPPRQAVVVYEVSGEAAHATVTYSTFTEGGPATHRVELTSFPWRAELVVDGEPRAGVFTVTIGTEGGSVACRVHVDGVQRRSGTATGPRTSALCSGF